MDKLQKIREILEDAIIEGSTLSEIDKIVNPENEVITLLKLDPDEFFTRTPNDLLKYIANLLEMYSNYQNLRFNVEEGKIELKGVE